MKYECNPLIDYFANGKFDRDGWFDHIIDICDDMKAYDTLIVYDFGKNGDLLLDIQKDPDYEGGDEWNMVRVYTDKNVNGFMEEVDDTDDTYVNDGSLFKELDRIWNEEDFSLIN